MRSSRCRPTSTIPGGTGAAPLRLVSVTFRLLETKALAVDLGRGPAPVAFRRLGTALLDAPPPALHRRRAAARHRLAA